MDSKGISKSFLSYFKDKWISVGDIPIDEQLLEAIPQLITWDDNQAPTQAILRKKLICDQGDAW